MMVKNENLEEKIVAKGQSYLGFTIASRKFGDGGHISLGEAIELLRNERDAYQEQIAKEYGLPIELVTTTMDFEMQEGYVVAKLYASQIIA